MGKKNKIDVDVELRLEKEFEEEMDKLQEELDRFFKMSTDERWEQYSKPNLEK